MGLRDKEGEGIESEEAGAGLQEISTPERIYLKPIKIRKEDKSCPNCKNFIFGSLCSLAIGKTIPAKVHNSGCKRYKKNKSLYF